MAYDIKFTLAGREIADDYVSKADGKQVKKKIRELRNAPGKRGKPLRKPLDGLRGIACGRKYRIVYEVDSEEKVVYIYGVGLRKEGDRDNVYNVVKKSIGY